MNEFLNNEHLREPAPPSAELPFASVMSELHSHRATALILNEALATAAEATGADRSRKSYAMLTSEVLEDDLMTTIFLDKPTSRDGLSPGISGVTYADMLEGEVYVHFLKGPIEEEPKYYLLETRGEDQFSIFYTITAEGVAVKLDDEDADEEFLAQLKGVDPGVAEELIDKEAVMAEMDAIRSQEFDAEAAAVALADKLAKLSPAVFSD